MPIQPTRRLDDHRSSEKLCEGQRGREQQDQSPSAGRRKLQAHCLGDHDADNDGKLGEHAYTKITE